MIKNQC